MNLASTDVFYSNILSASTKASQIPLLATDINNDSIDPNFVVTRDSKGNPLSKFSDEVWDFTYFGFNYKTKKILFEIPEDFDKDACLLKENFDQAKYLILLSLYSGISYQFSVFVAQALGIRKLAFIAVEKGASIKELISDGTRLIYYTKVNQYFSRYLINLDGILREWSLSSVGFSYKPFKRTHLLKFKKYIKLYKVSNKQTPIIPSRIYLNFSNAALDELNSFDEVIQDFIDISERIFDNPVLGVQKRNIPVYNHKWTSADFVQDFSDLIKEYPMLYECLNSYTWVENRSATVLFKYALNHMLTVCLDIVMYFTGMRTGEAQMLPFNCVKIIFIDGKKHYLVYGLSEKKGENKNLQEMWVTSKHGYKAIKTAQKIAKLIYDERRKVPVELTDTSLEDYSVFETRLFCRVSELFAYCRKGIKKDISKLELHAKSNPYNTKFSKNDSQAYSITEADFDELILIDPHRDWNAEPAYQVGQTFCLQRRQFRRSLAIYATAANSVSTPSLRRQFHHEYDEMTMYYAKGSSFAKHLFSNNESFAIYFNNVKPEAELVSMTASFLCADDKFFGARGIFAGRDNTFRYDIIEGDRNDTLKKFRDGKLAYKDTPLGGCGALKQCDKKAYRSITACLTCDMANISLKKLQNVINESEYMVCQTEKESVQYRMEHMHLIELLEYAVTNLSKWISSLKKTTGEYKENYDLLAKYKDMLVAYKKESFS